MIVCEVARTKQAIEIAEEKREKGRATALKQQAKKRDEPLDAETEKRVKPTLAKPSRNALSEAATMTSCKAGRTQTRGRETRRDT